MGHPFACGDRSSNGAAGLLGPARTIATRRMSASRRGRAETQAGARLRSLALPLRTSAKSIAEVARLAELLGLPSGTRILEVLCSIGRCTVPLVHPEFRVTGVSEGTWEPQDANAPALTGTLPIGTARHL